MFDYFETPTAIYNIFNGKYFVHLKEWDDSPNWKYHKTEISESEYVSAYLQNSAAV